MTAGSPRTDLCDVTDDLSSGSFDTATGTYSFFTSNEVDYPAGTYAFEITADVGTGPTKSVVSTF